MPELPQRGVQLDGRELQVTAEGDRGRDGPLDVAPGASAPEATPRLGDRHRLLLIVLAATATRAAALWIGRGEFTGWLNHTYYYFVQVRGLLERGRLPYPDMPVLFWLDAGGARALIAAGAGARSAIVASTRLVMCLVPSLIPVSLYLIVRHLNGPGRIRRTRWILILLSGFLPLSILYLPEVLQKNLLGLWLLSVLILFTQRLLRRPDARSVIATLALAVVIVLSHFGTFGAMVLYGVALLLAHGLVHRSLRKAVAPGLALALGAAIAVTLIYLLDIRRFGRLLVYARESVGRSLLGGVLGGAGGRTGALASLAVVLGVYAGLYVVYRVCARESARLSAPDRVFWLASLLFCGLLLLPVLDEHLMGRLVIFTSLPLLVLLVHLEEYGLKRLRWRAALAGLAAGATALMAIGELISARVHDEGNAAVLSDLEELRARHPFRAGDLVITRTGAEHLCNWFYDVEAGVITSLRLDDFERHDRIYVLNPIQGTLDFEGLQDRTASSEADRYFFMLKDVPRPANVEPLFVTENIELFRLEAPPAEWAFDEDGRFHAYSKRLPMGR